MSLPRHHPAVGLVLLLVAASLAGCVSDLDTGAGAPASRYASFDEAKQAGVDADGPMLSPLDKDSRVRAQLISPTGYQALDTGAAELVVLVFSQRTQEPVLDATVAVETDRGESADLTEDAHGVYAGELALTGVGETSANLTVDADNRTLVFPFEIASYATVDEVSETNSLVYEPAAGDGSLRLKLLSPEEPLETEKGQAPFTFLLFDADTGQPVTGAEASLASWMPPHGLPEGGRMPGHGTHSEVDPVHHRLGIYQGRTNIVMNGTWWTNVTVVVDGEGTAFQITSDVGSGGHSHGDDDGHDDHDHRHETSFGSFTAALAANGTKVEMTNGSEAMTAKLLVPAGNVSQGNQTVKILLHRPEADRPAPVPLARQVAFDVHKHAHGDTVHADTTGVVHSGSGIWTARTNLTEPGTWSVHVDVETLDGTAFDGKFEITVDEGSGGDDEDCHTHPDGTVHC